MTAKIIDGKEIASKILFELKEQVSHMERKPGISIIIVGDNPVSQVYVRIKEKRCNEVGIICNKIVLDKEIGEDKLIEAVNKVNNDNQIDGMIVQLPLPKHINKRKVLNAIDPKKDVDGLHPYNLGSLMINDSDKTDNKSKLVFSDCSKSKIYEDFDHNKLIPATALGVIKLLDSTGVDLSGKHATVIGRSELVGKPVSLLLQQKNCTVTMCHSGTKDLEKIVKFSDIVVVAIGNPGMIKKEMVKEGAIVIDVGINKVEEKIVGDVDSEVSEVAGYLTPVPGGVGPMTVACLLSNVVRVCKES